MKKLIILLCTIFLLFGCSSINNDDDLIKRQLKEFQKYQNQRNIFKKNSNGIYDFRAVKINNEKINDKELLYNVIYDSLTNWSNEMNNNYNFSKILENCKKGKLGLEEIHKELNGKGVGIAMIGDIPFTGHEEINNSLKLYENRFDKGNISAESTALTSIVIGKKVGVSPASDLYYIAEDSTNKENYYSNVANDIEEILKKNNGSIKMIILNLQLYEDLLNTEGYKNLEKAIDKAKKENIEIFSTYFNKLILDYLPLSRIDVNELNNFENYIPTNDLHNNFDENFIFVPTNQITVASPFGKSEYTYMCETGVEGINAYLAGLYALACQKNPSITFERFTEVARTTAFEKDYKGKTIKIINLENLFRNI